MKTASKLGVLAAGTAVLPWAPAVQALSRDYLSALKGLECKSDFPEPEDTLTPFNSITSYNNYYEFSTDKKAPAILAQALDIDPWEVSITGLVEQPVTLNMKDILEGPLVHRTYRLRCVEGWSMVIPWCGVVLSELLKAVKLKPEAKYVRFVSAYEPKAMIGQRRKTLDWPYEEGLRLDEALNPLTLMAVGLYDKTLPKQNGAPIRLVVPWKYGFKSIKAVKTIELVKDQPTSSWMASAPSEYGFYANVNPKVAHPRWSQRREVRIGEAKKRKTLMFNGYEKHVAHLYEGMDLKEFF